MHCLAKIIQASGFLFFPRTLGATRQICLRSSSFFLHSMLSEPRVDISQLSCTHRYVMALTDIISNLDQAAAEQSPIRDRTDDALHLDQYIQAAERGAGVRPPDGKAPLAVPRPSAVLSETKRAQPAAACDMMYPMYADAMTEREAEVEQALGKAWRAYAAVSLTAKWYQRSATGQCQQLPGLRETVVEVLFPGHLSLGAYGDKKSTALETNSDELSLKLEAGVAKAVAALVLPGKAAPAAKSGAALRPLHALATELAVALDAATTEYDDALDRLYTLAWRAREASAKQHAHYVLPAARECDQLWERLRAFYEDGLRKASTTLDLQNVVAAEVTRLVDATGAVVRRYVAAVQQMVALVAPKLKANARALLDTPELRHVVRLVDAARPILQGAAAAPAWMADRAADQDDVSLALQIELPADVTAMDMAHLSLATLFDGDEGGNDATRALYIALKRREVAVLAESKK